MLVSFRRLDNLRSWCDHHRSRLNHDDGWRWSGGDGLTAMTLRALVDTVGAGASDYYASEQHCYSK